MELLTKRSDCEAALSGLSNSILDNYLYKAILNKHYQPEEYLFFRDNNDLIPLVLKDNLVTFYGGTRHNWSNTLPDNPALINEVLSYLNKRDYAFRLLPINRDYFTDLNVEHRVFDVPFEPEWHLSNVQNYDQETFLASLSGKKRWSHRRVLRHMESYEFETVSHEDFKPKFFDVMEAHCRYFSQRGKLSAWYNAEHLLGEILEYFSEHENLLIRQVTHDGAIVAVYTIVYNSQEMIHYFGGSVKKDDNYISKAVYFDMLSIGKELSLQLNLSELNGLRGAFTNKKSFGYEPVPLYALVKDSAWIVRRDADISEEQYDEIYGRQFGIESHNGGACE